jgi:hypothetical protein
MMEKGGTVAVLVLAKLKVSDFARDIKTGLATSASTASDHVDNGSIDDASSRLVKQLTWADTVDLTQIK